MDDIFIFQNVILTNLLRLMLNARSPNPSVLQTLNHLSVDTITEDFNGRRRILLDNDGFIVVRDLTLGLGVEAEEI